jgi:hypothetical protein
MISFFRFLWRKILLILCTWSVRPSVLKPLFPVITLSLELTTHVISLLNKSYIHKLKPFITIVFYSIRYMAFDKSGKGINLLMYSLCNKIIFFIGCRFQWPRDLNCTQCFTDALLMKRTRITAGGHKRMYVLFSLHIFLTSWRH